MRPPKYIWDPKTPGLLPSQQDLFNTLSPPVLTSTRNLARTVLPQRIPSFDDKTNTLMHGNSSQFRYDGRRSDRIWKAVRQKRIIRGISAVNAVASWVATVIGYFVVSMRGDGGNSEGDARDALKVAILGISMVQTVLIAFKWNFKRQFMCIVDSALKPGGASEDSSDPQSFRHSLSSCVLECACHLVTFIPGVDLRVTVKSFGLNSQFALDDVVYLCLLGRNYHSLESLFWWSKMAEVRSHLFSHLINVRVTRGFIFRWFMTEYAWRIVVTVILAIVLIPGAIEYLFARIDPINRYYTIWSEYWLVSFTQASMGYETDSINTLLGEASLLISCISGLSLLGLTTSITLNNMDLNLTECNLYSELLFARYKSKFSENAAKLIQRWWKLMLSRMRKSRKAETVTKYFSYVREYRSVLTKCQTIKDRRFERQIDAFDLSVSKMFRPLNEYLNPIRDAHGFVIFTQVQDIVRNQYRIEVSISNLCARVKRNYQLAPHSPEAVTIAIDAKVSPGKKKARRAVPNSGQGFARAKNLAFSNVRGRLIRNDCGTLTLRPR